jgi:uncharacterized coiled-coil protein SlyX
MLYIPHHKSIAYIEMTTSNIFQYRGYWVDLCFGEGNIRLGFSEILSDARYVAVMQQKDFRVQYDLQGIYKVMLATFSENDFNYGVDISILYGFMKLQFHALVSGFLNVQFEVMLKETVLVTEASQSSRIQKAIREFDENNLTKESLLKQLAEKVFSNAQHIMTLNEMLAQQRTKLLEMEHTVAQQNHTIQQLNTVNKEMQDILSEFEVQSRLDR